MNIVYRLTILVHWPPRCERLIVARQVLEDARVEVLKRSAPTLHVHLREEVVISGDV